MWAPVEMSSDPLHIFDPHAFDNAEDESESSDESDNESVRARERETPPAPDGLGAPSEAASRGASEVGEPEGVGKVAASSTNDAEEKEDVAFTPADAVQCDTVLMEGLLEKKPVRGFGMIERGLGGGWRLRRVILRPGVIEWHHTDADEVEPDCVQLHPTVTRVRACGDPGDDVSRCLTIDAGGSTLVLRAGDEVERDAWLRAAVRCIERLKAAAFDAAIAAATAQLERVRVSESSAAYEHTSVRLGVQLLMSRFYASSAVAAAGAHGGADEADEESAHADLASALGACLLTHQAEARLARAAAAGHEWCGPSTDEELDADEAIGLRLFAWCRLRIGTGTESILGCHALAPRPLCQLLGPCASPTAHPQPTCQPRSSRAGPAAHVPPPLFASGIAGTPPSPAASNAPLGT